MSGNNVWGCSGVGELVSRHIDGVHLSVVIILYYYTYPLSRQYYSRDYKDSEDDNRLNYEGGW